MQLHAALTCRLPETAMVVREDEHVLGVRPAELAFWNPDNRNY
jgi:hypothetical protein